LSGQARPGTKSSQLVFFHRGPLQYTQEKVSQLLSPVCLPTICCGTSQSKPAVLRPLKTDPWTGQQWTPHAIALDFVLVRVLISLLAQVPLAPMPFDMTGGERTMPEETLPPPYHSHVLLALSALNSTRLQTPAEPPRLFISTALSRYSTQPLCLDSDGRVLLLLLYICLCIFFPGMLLPASSGTAAA
jgi:hypothetical protein